MTLSEIYQKNPSKSHKKGRNEDTKDQNATKQTITDGMNERMNLIYPRNLHQ